MLTWRIVNEFENISGNTSKFVRNTPMRVIFPTLFSVFVNTMNGFLGTDRSSVWEELGQTTVFRLIIRRTIREIIQSKKYGNVQNLINGIVIKNIKPLLPVRWSWLEFYLLICIFEIPWDLKEHGPYINTRTNWAAFYNQTGLLESKNNLNVFITN